MIYFFRLVLQLCFSNQAAQDQMMECKMEEMTKAEVQDIKMETQGTILLR